jgi:hypothetical protein
MNNGDQEDSTALRQQLKGAQVERERDVPSTVLRIVALNPAVRIAAVHPRR